MLLHIIPAEVQGLDVGFKQPFLAFVLLGKEFFKNIRIHIEQHRQGPDVNNVLEQLALPGIDIGRVADLCQRYADDMNVLAEFGLWNRPCAVIKQVAARLNLGHVGIPGLWVHRHHHVDAAAPPVIALFAHPRFIPGRHALDIAWKDVARAHRYAHAHHGLGKQLIGRSRSGAVDVGKLDDEIVDGFDAFHAVS